MESSATLFSSAETEVMVNALLLLRLLLLHLSGFPSLTQTRDTGTAGLVRAHETLSIGTAGALKRVQNQGKLVEGWSTETL